MPGAKIVGDVSRTRMIPEGTDAVSPAPHHDKDKFEDIPILAIGIENPETGEAEIQLDMDVENYRYKYLLN